MRLNALLRPPPSLTDVERALLSELGGYGDGERQVPNSWQLHLAPGDHRRRAGDLRRWASTLAARLVAEHDRLGLPASGLVTVAFVSDPDVEAGRFRVGAGVVVGPAPVVPQTPLVHGRPRLTLAAGGAARIGTPRAAGIDREVVLPAGTFVIGRDKGAALRLTDTTVSPRHLELEVGAERVGLRDLGSLNGTAVDGVPTATADLVDGNRIEIGSTTLVFHRDDHTDDGGRQGGEGELPGRSQRP